MGQEAGGRGQSMEGGCWCQATAAGTASRAWRLVQHPRGSCAAGGSPLCCTPGVQHPPPLVHWLPHLKRLMPLRLAEQEPTLMGWMSSRDAAVAASMCMWVALPTWHTARLPAASTSPLSISRYLQQAGGSREAGAASEWPAASGKRQLVGGSGSLCMNAAQHNHQSAAPT